MADMNMLACPFCSSTAVHVYDFDREAQVECADCGGRGPTVGNDDVSRRERHEEAIAGWNSATESKTVAGAWELPEN